MVGRKTLKKRHLNNGLEITNSMGASPRTVKLRVGNAAALGQETRERGAQSKKMQLGAVTPPRPPFVIVLGSLGTRFKHLHTTPTGSRSLSWGPGALSVALSRCLEHPVCMVTGIPEAPPEAGRLPYQDLHLNMKVA